MSQETITTRIAAIRALPSQLSAVVADLDDHQLDTPYRDGGWTVRQVVHHLADSHMNAFIRFKLGLTEDEPTIKPYNQESWAELADTTSLPIASSLKLIEGLHARWAVLLDEFSESDWKRRINHPESGTMDLGRLLEIYAAHGVKHVEHIAGLRRRQGW